MDRAAQGLGVALEGVDRAAVTTDVPARLGASGCPCRPAPLAACFGSFRIVTCMGPKEAETSTRNVKRIGNVEGSAFRVAPLPPDLYHIGGDVSRRCMLVVLHFVFCNLRSRYILYIYIYFVKKKKNVRT